jgi:hypothetical protein
VTAGGISTCTDSEAKLWIYGVNGAWSFGPRTLTRVSNRRYEYGDEVVFHNGTAWEYYYQHPGESKVSIEIVTGNQAWPWLVPWVDFTAQKLCLPPVYPAYRGGDTIYTIGDRVSHGGGNYVCIYNAGSVGYGPFGGYLDGTANGIIYWLLESSAPSGIAVSTVSTVRLSTGSNLPDWIVSPVSNNFLLERRPANNVIDTSYTDEDGNYVPRSYSVGPNQNYIHANGNIELIAPGNLTQHPGSLPNTPVNYWRLFYYTDNCSDGLCSKDQVEQSTNPSTDPTRIPISGWTSVPSYGGSVTITAAPTTLPLSTPFISINGDGPFYRANDEAWAYDGPNPPDGYGYSLRYSTPYWELAYYSNNDEQITLSSNTANSTAIPLTGWSSPITITASAPSGLPYSSTNSLNLVDPDYPNQNGNYPKTNVGTYTDDIGVTTTNIYGNTSYGSLAAYNRYISFNVTTNRWELGVYESYGEGGLAWYGIASGANFALNPSSNQNYIPTSSWSRNIVITAGG